MKKPKKKQRSSGILLHITSLPSKFGAGDLGPPAYKFADFLADSGQKYWQILPINPPTVNYLHCPYSATSAFAADPLLISPQHLQKQGLLTRNDTKDLPQFPKGKVNFTKSYALKRKLFNKAYKNFKNKPPDPAFETFCENNASWLNDYALFIALKNHFQTGFWCDWPKELKDREPNAIQTAESKFAAAMNKQKFLQYQFARQWAQLKKYCKAKSISIIGDIPIYLAYDSADVWANQQFFKLNKNKKPAFVAGTPPDNFCKTGQNWGNPVYDWNMLKKDNFSWWIDRIKHNLNLFDMVRIDHFRAFVAFWQIPAANKTAAKGRWIRAPKDTFFKTLFKNISPKSIIVEDLGAITPAVRQAVNDHSMTGMRILQYAFANNPLTNPHYIKNHPKRSVVYTGTHDNNTIMGWLNNELTENQKQAVLKTIDAKPNAKDINWKLIELAMSSRSNLSIIPMQDIMSLDEKARMNIPGTIENNWNWQINQGQLRATHAKKLYEITKRTKRL